MSPILWEWGLDLISSGMAIGRGRRAMRHVGWRRPRWEPDVCGTERAEPLQRSRLGGSGQIRSATRS